MVLSHWFSLSCNTVEVEPSYFGKLRRRSHVCIRVGQVNHRPSMDRSPFPCTHTLLFR